MKCITTAEMIIEKKTAIKTRHSRKSAKFSSCTSY